MTRAQLLDLNDRVERRTHIEHSAFVRAGLLRAAADV